MNSVTRKPSLGAGKLSKSMCGVCSVTVTSLPELPPGDLLEVKEPKPKPAKIRAVSYEAANDPLFKRMRSSSSALTVQAVSTPRGQVRNESGRRRPPHGRRTGTTGE